MVRKKDSLGQTHYITKKFWLIVHNSYRSVDLLMARTGKNSKITRDHAAYLLKRYRKNRKDG